MPRVHPSFIRVSALARVTLIEALRDHMAVGVLLVAALITASTFFMSTVSLDQNARVLQNTGLAAIHICTVLIMIMTTTNTVAREMERRTLYLLLPKPLSPGEYAIGKFLGSFSLATCVLLVLSILFALGVAFQAPAILGAAAISIFFTWLELGIMTALTVLFSLFTQPLNAALYSIGFFIIGHSLTVLREFASNAPALLQRVIDVFYFVVPNLEKLNIRPNYLYELPLSTSVLAVSIVYAVCYSGFLLLIAVRVMRMREV